MNLPNGIVFLVQSKNAQQSKWQTDSEFIPDVSKNYHESDAFKDANTAFQEDFGSHNGETKEYRLVKCIEQGYEVRP